MGVDFVLEQSCPVKEQLSTEGLVELVKSRNRAEAILELARQKGNTKPASEIFITQRLVTPNGTEDKQTSVQSLYDQAAPLDDLAHHCEQCWANLTNSPFGCYGSIRYPITLATERWLMDLLPKDPDCTAGKLLQKYVKDFKYDGMPVLQLRDRPTIFEDRNGHSLTWKPKGFLGRFSTGFSFTSSQLLQMMFCLRQLQPTHCTMLCVFLGLIPHNSEPDALLDREAFKKVAFTVLGSPPPDNPALFDFLHFFDALLWSVALDVPLLVDY